MKPQILVADDSPDMLFFYHSIFKSNYEVLEAKDADEALTILQIQSTVRAIVSDYDMPGADKAYFDTLLCSGLPTVIVTGHASPQLPPGLIVRRKGLIPPSELLDLVQTLAAA